MAHNFDNFTDHRAASPANSNYSHHSDHSQPRTQRRREDSTTPRHASAMSTSSLGSPQTPIGEAVNTAFNKAQHDTANAIPPELLAQLTQTVTQTVIKQLQATGLDGAAQAATAPPRPQSIHVPPPPQPILHNPTPQSPSTNASSSSPIVPNRVYTPPSPEKHGSIPHISPEHSQPIRLPDAPHSPTKETHFDPRPSASPLSYGSEGSDKDYQRPKGPTRLSTEKEETTLERIWGQLFDEESHPTMRLGQFLRGLAVHIIEDYEPRHSIVVTPDKMAKYYSDMQLSSEAYPWATVFDDEQTSISRMYRDLGCQHHLVQERFHERPVIPGLTPLGFERWVTQLIQAHPEAEFERLQKAVLHMPINNPDDKKERFPKEISRRLFPGHEDTRIRHLIEDSIAEHAAIDIPRRSSHDDLHADSSTRSHSRQPSPPHKSSTASENPYPHKPSVAESPYVPQSHRPSVSFAEPAPASTASSHIPQTNHLERERKPYSAVPAESTMDEPLPPSGLPPNNIERERKPYVAQPGGGKTYEDEQSRVTKPRAESIINNSNSARPTRSDSTATRARPIPINNNAPPRSLDPRPEIHNHRTPNFGGRRQRSPSFSRGSTNDFRRSDGDIRGYQPTFEPGSMPRDGGGAVFDESDTRRYFDQQAKARAEKARRQAEDDARHYGESPRRDYDRDRYVPGRRGDHANDEEYYRAGGRGEKGNGYDYQQPHGGPVYR